jgi:acyl carrier protein
MKSTVASSNLPEKIRRLFRDKLYVDVASEETDLLREGFLDSLSLVELILHIEQEFQVEIPLEELEIETFRSIRAISQFLESRIARQP